MKAHLMYPDRDFDPDGPLPSNTDDLTRDLELNVLFEAMAAGDPFLRDVARHGVLSRVDDPDTIRYRQQVLTDCLEHPDVARGLYDLTVSAIEAERQAWGYGIGRTPSFTLMRSLEVLELFESTLRHLRQTADDHADAFGSEGFRELFRMLQKELDDEYLRRTADHLQQLKFNNGVLLSARLGTANMGTGYVLRRPWPPKSVWSRLRHGLGDGDRPASYSFWIPDRDESGARALGELKDKGLHLVATAAARSAEHILDFLRMLRAELGFYVGCLNLHERLTGKGEPTCLPVPLPATAPALTCCGLYDTCLSLNLSSRAVGNDVNADQTTLVMITGANQGGKSTLLRGLGLAQLMMQCGMFVAAESYASSISSGVFTHFKREEDAGMHSGKFDEELRRMSAVVDAITPNSLLLCNESFASTNEREGSEIARQIVRALLDSGVRVLFVTHLYDLAHSCYEQRTHHALFLRAERETGGQRTFKLREGEPLPTSYGEDLYRRIFTSAEGLEPADRR
jgi:hypothetical protein